jgi:hypothetical protein
MINGKKIRFDPMEFYAPYLMYGYDNNDERYIKDKNAITKDDIKEYLFFEVMIEIVRVKENAKKMKFN